MYQSYNNKCKQLHHYTGNLLIFIWVFVDFFSADRYINFIFNVYLCIKQAYIL
jgi:hypothetical protein